MAHSKLDFDASSSLLDHMMSMSKQGNHSEYPGHIPTSPVGDLDLSPDSGAFNVPVKGVSCFAAGTLVHTKEGLKPIEQIKVGDYVLSKPENGGKQEYKRVLQTFVMPPERVIRVNYRFDADKSQGYTLMTTLNHPFWVKGQGWSAAENLNHDWLNYKQLELHDGRNATAVGTTNIYVSAEPDVGWLPSFMGDVEGKGTLLDFVNKTVVARDVPALESIQMEEHPDPYFKLPVYNLEVEDFHTYYVGEHGIWVHNCNRGGENFETLLVG